MDMHDGVAKAAKLEDFNAGGRAYGMPNFRGRRINEGTTGSLDAETRERFYSDANRVDYVIYSYRTPIAWHTPDGWVLVNQKFSSSTSRQQSAVRSLEYKHGQRTTLV